MFMLFASAMLYMPVVNAAYCDTISPNDRNRCWQIAVDTNNRAMNKEFGKLIKSGAYSQEEVNEMIGQHNYFVNDVNRQCRSNECVSEALSKQRYIYMRINKKNGVN